MLRLGNTRPLPGHSCIGSIRTRTFLRFSVPPPTTESNKGDSVPASGKNQAWRLPGVHPELQLQGEDPTATRGLLATEVILNHGQVTSTTPELAPPLLTTTPHQREDVSALDRFNVHRCPTRRDFSGTGLEPVTKQATVRYLYHSATAAVNGFQNDQTKNGFVLMTFTGDGKCLLFLKGLILEDVFQQLN
ncbi:uncharacterized protein TNCV_1953211 [Trichonephila clavipes]|nr:uncharacterized protein TNCV_1953211 [Trichonephila clavipes]